MGIKIKVNFSNGEIKYHTLPFGLSVSEIYGWVGDKYGQYEAEHFEIISGFD